MLTRYYVVGFAATLLALNASRCENYVFAEEQPARLVTNSIGMKLGQIPAGECLMGSADADLCASEDEQPRHPVRIDKPFSLAVFEVTQGDFEKIMHSNSGLFSRAGLLRNAAEDLASMKTGRAGARSDGTWKAPKLPAICPKNRIHLTKDCCWSAVTTKAARRSADPKRECSRKWPGMIAATCVV